MHTGKIYKLKEFLFWTRRDIYALILIASVPTILYFFFGCKWLAIPWVPVGLVGTSAAFIVGFKNTQTYNRLWEARQIWGAIINGSRSWGMMVKDFIKAENPVHKQLFYRHFAWLTALRFQLRKPQIWETQTEAFNKEYHRLFSVDEWDKQLEDELANYLSEEERQYIITKKNRATQIISLQSKHLAQLKDKGLIEPLEYVELEQRLSDFYDQQGKCERIKNFPYPRHFASLSLFFVWLFVGLLPLGLLNEFQKLGTYSVWFTIPASVVVSWVFTSMERIGSATENPFEGDPNDVPVTALSRTIEIDLRDMLDEVNLPQPLTAVNNILM